MTETSIFTNLLRKTMQKHTKQTVCKEHILSKNLHQSILYSISKMLLYKNLHK